MARSLAAPGPAAGERPFVAGLRRASRARAGCRRGFAGRAALAGDRCAYRLSCAGGDGRAGPNGHEHAGSDGHCNGRCNGQSNSHCNGHANGHSDAYAVAHAAAYA